MACRLIFALEDSVEPEKITLGKFLERWLRDAAKPTLKATTFANYERAVERSIKPKPPASSTICSRAAEGRNGR